MRPTLPSGAQRREGSEQRARDRRPRRPLSSRSHANGSSKTWSAPSGSSARRIEHVCSEERRDAVPSCYPLSLRRPCDEIARVSLVVSGEKDEPRDCAPVPPASRRRSRRGAGRHERRPSARAGSSGSAKRPQADTPTSRKRLSLISGAWRLQGADGGDRDHSSYASSISARATSSGPVSRPSSATLQGVERGTRSGSAREAASCAVLRHVMIGDSFGPSMKNLCDATDREPSKLAVQRLGGDPHGGTVGVRPAVALFPVALLIRPNHEVESLNKAVVAGAARDRSPHVFGEPARLC